MIRKWLLTAITTGALVAGLVGCQEQQQQPAPKAGTKKAAPGTPAKTKPGTKAQPGTKAKPAPATKAKPSTEPAAKK